MRGSLPLDAFDNAWAGIFEGGADEKDVDVQARTIAATDQDVAEVSNMVGVLIDKNKVGANLEALSARGVQRRVCALDRAKQA